MRFVISFFISLSAMASPIRIYHEDALSFATKVKETLMEKYLIPEELISIRGTSNCLSLEGRGPLDLCLKNNGDLLLVSIDQGFVDESLRIFRAP